MRKQRPCLCTDTCLCHPLQAIMQCCASSVTHERALFTSQCAVQIDQAAQQLAEQQLQDAVNEPLPDNDDDELLEG